MAVIINELEVVLESLGTSGPAAPGAAPSAAPTSQQVQPIDVADILQREIRADFRLFAH